MGVNRLKDVAHQLAVFARASGERLLHLQSTISSGRLKAAGALVTQADEESHAILSKLIGQHFPQTAVVMEEQSNPELLPETYIVADELDGTALYARGLDQWAVTLAYVERGAPVAGVLHQPARSQTIIAWRGGGAWANGRRLQLESALPLDQQIAILELNRYASADELTWMRNIAASSLVTRALACAVASSIELLTGHAALYLNLRGGKVWDFAAAVVAVEEAGGVVSSASGSSLEWGRAPMGVLFAASEQVRNRVLELRGMTAIED